MFQIKYISEALATHYQKDYTSIKMIIKDFFYFFFWNASKLIVQGKTDVELIKDGQKETRNI